MTRLAQGLWGFLSARSATLGRKRLAGVFVAWWAVFWAANVLSPCCDVLAAAVPHGHGLHSMTADHDADHAAGDHAPHPQCATISAIDMAAPNAVPLIIAKLQLPDTIWLPTAAVVPASIRQAEASHPGYSWPPPLLRLYLRTSRLLI
jgi:hypothetical protein